jgi:magnesium-transporting ATPase (P-type)
MTRAQQQVKQASDAAVLGDLLQNQPSTSHISNGTPVIGDGQLQQHQHQAVPSELQQHEHHQQQEHVQLEAAPPARVIKAHLSRPAVSRGLLHHIAKAFNIHLQGSVATNEISTAKYTLLTFLPVNLFEQFLRVANLYFLFMAILQLIPGLSPTSWFTTVAPLVFVLAVNAIKEGYDDVHRHKNDNQINNRHVLLLSNDREEHEIYWKDVVAGDLIKVGYGADALVGAGQLLVLHILACGKQTSSNSLCRSL